MTIDLVWRASFEQPRAKEYARAFKLSEVAFPSDSSLNFVVAELDDRRHLSDAIREFLRDRADMIDALERYEARSQLDAGLYVVPDLPATLVLDPTDLGLLSEAGIEFSVSAYPCAE